MKTIPNTIQKLIAELKSSQDPALLAAEQREGMRFFEDNGPWAHAPKSAMKESLDKIVARQAQRTGLALYRLRSYIGEHMDAVRMEVEVAKHHAPTPQEAWDLLTGRAGLSAEAMFTRDLLHETRWARYDRELTTAPASRIRQVYELAAIDPHEQANASLIAWVEQHHGEQWTGVTSTDNKDLDEVQKLRTSITKVREDRVPVELRQASAAIQEARRLVGVSEGLGIKPVQPTADDQEDEA